MTEFRNHGDFCDDGDLIRLLRYASNDGIFWVTNFLGDGIFVMTAISAVAQLQSFSIE